MGNFFLVLANWYKTCHGPVLFLKALIKRIFKLGLKRLYNSSPKIQERLRCYIALCFVPVADVPAAFQQLCHQDPIPELVEFQNYFQRTWLGTLTHEAIYPIKIWNYYANG